MDKAGTTGWSETLMRPQGTVEVAQEPDGAFHIHWAWERHQLTVLLTLRQLRDLGSSVVNASMLAHDPDAAVEVPS